MQDSLTYNMANGGQSAPWSVAGGRVVAQLASVDVRADAKLPDMQQWLEQHQLPFRRRLLQQGGQLLQWQQFSAGVDRNCADPIAQIHLKMPASLLHAVPSCCPTPWCA